MNFVILHGTLGKPEDNWYPSLARELEKRGHRVIRPTLPTPKGQTLRNWVSTIADSVEKLGLPNDQVIIVAHSMSPLSVCHFLTTQNTPVDRCFFVAGFAERLPDTPEPYPTLNNPFIDTPIDWKMVRKGSQKFICFGSDNDPYVPLPIAQNFARHLGAPFILVPSAGHFNTTSGYTTFPLLLDTIHKEIRPA